MEGLGVRPRMRSIRMRIGNETCSLYRAGSLRKGMGRPMLGGKGENGDNLVQT